MRIEKFLKVSGNFADYFIPENIKKLPLLIAKSENKEG